MTQCRYGLNIASAVHQTGFPDWALELKSKINISQFMANLWGCDNETGVFVDIPWTVCHSQAEK